MFFMKYSDRPRFSSSESDEYRAITTPCDSSSGITSSRKQRECSSTSGSTSLRITASCSTGVSSPGIGPRSSILSISLIPETRTMKNSSRFEEKTARNFSRSSTGFDLSVASSSTRRKNSNWHKSRLRTDHERKRFGFDLDCESNAIEFHYPELFSRKGAKLI